MTGAQREFLSQMGLEKYQRVEYRDLKGVPINFSQFQKLQPAFPSFSMEKRKNGAVASAVISLQAAQTTPAAPQYKLKPGAAFPAFKLPATDATVVDNAALHGKYTLLNFYFAECAPCIKEVPMLNAFAIKRKDVTVLAVTFDTDKDAKAFAKQTHFGWRTIANANQLIDKVGVKGYPTFALLDPKGALVAFGDQGDVGVQDGALEMWVTRMIAAKSI